MASTGKDVIDRLRNRISVSVQNLPRLVLKSGYGPGIQDLFPCANSVSIFLSKATGGVQGARLDRTLWIYKTETETRLLNPRKPDLSLENFRAGECFRTPKPSPFPTPRGERLSSPSCSTILYPPQPGGALNELSSLTNGNCSSSRVVKGTVS